MSGVTPGGARPPLSGRQQGQIGVLTAGALLIWLGFWGLGKRPAALGPMDFVAGGNNALQFCDPNRPRFLPVATLSSPVTMGFSEGDPTRLTLATASGKPIGPDNLVPTAGAPLWLFLVDRGLMTLRVVKPAPGARPGEWTFESGMPAAGAFRVFADLSPAAVGRELYASADWDRSGGGAEGLAPTNVDPTWHFEFCTVPAKTYARQPLQVALQVRRADGGAFSVGTVGGAQGRLLAFDEAASGLVNLHSVETGAAPPSQAQAEMNFPVTFSDSGRYVLWAELNLNGQTIYQRFALDVLP
jgi:hypothetical protein